VERVCEEKSAQNSGTGSSDKSGSERMRRQLIDFIEIKWRARRDSNSRPPSS